ncbi:MAG: helix-turn-helix domain-containing protein, partial [archaeon]|nr:helix-turn-helix domain-containing protein [archaeon]
MFLRLRRGLLKDITSRAINKSGNIRKLEKETGISRSALSRFYNEKRSINSKDLAKLADYLRIKIKNKDILKETPDNMRQINGGKRCVELKKRRGTFAKQLELCHKKSSEYMKKLHKEMKKNSPKEYYRSQYEKFKKIGNYKYTTDNNEKVRNELERDLANALKKAKIDYQYEPFILIDNKAFFPDFLINNKIIIECTAWRGYDKAIKLKEKIS